MRLIRDRTARIRDQANTVQHGTRPVCRIGHCGSRAAGLVDGVSHGRALPLSPDLAAVPSRLLQVPFGDDRAGAVIVPGEKLVLLVKKTQTGNCVGSGLQPPTYDQSGTSGRGTPLGGSPTWTRDKCPPHTSRAAHGLFTDVALNVSQRASKSWRYVSQSQRWT